MVEEAKRKAEEKKWILVADALKDMKASSPTVSMRIILNCHHLACHQLFSELLSCTLRSVAERNCQTYA